MDNTLIKTFLNVLAAESFVAAAERMHQKGLITQPDGGALTDSGREAVEHMERLFNLLDPPLEPI